MGIPSTWTRAWGRSGVRDDARRGAFVILAYHAPAGTTDTDAERAVPDYTRAPGKSGVFAPVCKTRDVDPDQADGTVLVAIHYEAPSMDSVLERNVGKAMLFAETRDEQRLLRVAPQYTTVKDNNGKGGVWADAHSQHAGKDYHLRWRTIRGDPYLPIGHIRYRLRFAQGLTYFRTLRSYRNTINSNVVFGIPALHLLWKGYRMQHVLGKANQTLYEVEFEECPDETTWDKYTKVERSHAHVSKEQVHDDDGNAVDGEYEYVGGWTAHDTYTVDKWYGRHKSWDIASMALI